jgi:NRAMP (natural resistance-associated macrophage protein)-like metal ion transporter
MSAIGEKSKTEIQAAPTSFWKQLGPGLVTGASDDDPSGIGTYSQAGAGYGFGLLWTLVLSLPLMVAIQQISATIGRTTGRGIAGNIRRYYSAWLLYPIVFLLVLANTINLGADIGATGDAIALVIGGPALLYAAMFTVMSVLLQIFVHYRQYARYLKWLSLVLFSYVIVAVTVHAPLGAVLKGTFLPRLSLTRDYWATFIAILGTTISPYLFFWQASQENEEINDHAEQHALKSSPEQAPEQLRRIRVDTYLGMTVSNVIAFCIVVSAAVTLAAHGVTQVDTSTQAAEALRPLAGRASFLLFALGIVGMGLLAVPVLAGSAAYAVGEACGWPCGLGHTLTKAPGFYMTLILASLIGLAINLPFVQNVTHITPMRALFWSAVVNGVTAVPIMVVIMLMVNNTVVMGKKNRVSRSLTVIGWLATGVMGAAAVGMFLTWKQS